MSSDEVETFAVFDPMVLDPEDSESLIEDVTPSATRPSVALRSPPGTSGTSFTVFHSPSSDVSGLTGGVGVGLVSPVYCRIASELCGGVIGKSAGERFCCKPAELCEVQSHKSVKAALESDHIYIQGPKANQARLEPALKLSDLPDGMELSELLAMRRGIDVMKVYFKALIGRGGAITARNLDLEGLGAEGDWAELDVPTLEDLDKAKRSLKTPGKLKGGLIISEMRDAVPTLENVQSVPASGKASVSFQVMQAGWNNLVANVDLLSNEITLQQDGERELRAELGQNFLGLQEAINGGEAKLQLMMARIGDPVKAEDSSTIWESLNSFEKLIDSLQRRRDDIDKELANSSKDFDLLNKKVSNNGTSFTNLCKSYRESMDNIRDALRDIRTKIGQAPVAPNMFTSQAPAPASKDWNVPIQTLTEKVDNYSRGYVSKAQFDLLRTEVSELDRQMPGDPGAFSDLSPDHFRKEIEVLTMKIVDMESRVTDESFVHQDYSFGSIADLRNWVEANEVPTAGVYWDLFSVLSSMSPKHQTGKQKADEAYSAKRMDTTIFEIALSASMSHVKPELLYGKDTEDKLGFLAIGTFGDWVGQDGTSVKVKLDGYLNDFLDGIRGTISADSGGAAFAHSLLNLTQIQWTTFTAYVDTFYQELVYKSHFSPQVAFNLIGRSSVSIWKAMRRYRTKVALLPDMKSLRNKSAFIWSVMQCHRVMKEFIAVGFRGHPEFVKEMSLFMLTQRVDPSQLVCLEDKVNTNARDYHQIKKEYKALEEKSIP
jgi:hypothetical protein